MAQSALLAAIAVLLCCASASATLFTLPADSPVPGGHAVQSICLDCCQEGSYCGKTQADEHIPNPSNYSEQILVKKGTSMTCMMRARNVVGAVDGGLCVPDTFKLTAHVEHFCQADKQNFAPSFNLTEVIYQAGLKTQAADGPCCDGKHLCDASSTCRPTTGFKQPSNLVLPKAVCVPSSEFSDKSSQYHLDMKHEVLCETCDSLSPAARVIHDQNSGTPGSSSGGSGSQSSSTRTPSTANSDATSAGTSSPGTSSNGGTAPGGSGTSPGASGTKPGYVAGPSYAPPFAQGPSRGWGW